MDTDLKFKETMVNTGVTLKQKKSFILQDLLKIQKIAHWVQKVPLFMPMCQYGAT